MSMFKTKNKKNIITDSRITLDAKHNELIQQMIDEQKKLPDKKNKIQEYKDTIDTLSLQNRADWSEHDWSTYYHSISQIEALEKEIIKIESQDDMTNYFLDTAHILYQYYNQLESDDLEHEPSIPSLSYLPEDDIDEEEDEDDITPTLKKNTQSKKKVIVIQKEEPNKWKKKNVLDFFKQSPSESPIENNQVTNTPSQQPPPPIPPSSPEKSHHEIKNTITMSDYFDTDHQIRFHRSDLLEEYLKIVDPSFTPSKPHSYSYDYCERCKTEKVLYGSEGAIVCKKCGDTDYIMVESDKPSYKDPPPEISYFAYCILLWAEKLCAIRIRISNGKNTSMSWISL